MIDRRGSVWLSHLAQAWVLIGHNKFTLRTCEASSFTRFDQMKKTDENDATGEDDKVSESVGN